MAIKRAKILNEQQIQRVLMVAEDSPIRESNRLKVLLTFYAGLRVSEVAKLRVVDMLDAEGKISSHIHIYSHVGKNRRERSIPMHPIIKEALREFLKAFPDEEFVALPTLHNRLTVNALTIWFYKLYKRAGLEGCSSHSGRRTFITNLARNANQHGSSLKDVQLIAGHSRLDTTEAYIEPAQNVTRLVSSLSAPGHPKPSHPRLAYCGEDQMIPARRRLA